MRKFFSNKKGQGLVEYGLIIAGVALVCAAAISLFGHKTADLVAATAAILPGAHADDNGAIVTGKLIETSLTGTGATAEDQSRYRRNHCSRRCRAARPQLGYCCDRC